MSNGLTSPRIVRSTVYYPFSSVRVDIKLANEHVYGNFDLDFATEVESDSEELRAYIQQHRNINTVRKTDGCVKNSPSFCNIEMKCFR